MADLPGADATMSLAAAEPLPDRVTASPSRGFGTWATVAGVIVGLIAITAMAVQQRVVGLAPAAVEVNRNTATGSPAAHPTRPVVADVAGAPSDSARVTARGEVVPETRATGALPPVTGIVLKGSLTPVGGAILKGSLYARSAAASGIQIGCATARRGKGRAATRDADSVASAGSLHDDSAPSCSRTRVRVADRNAGLTGSAAGRTGSAAGRSACRSRGRRDHAR